MILLTRAPQGAGITGTRYPTLRFVLFLKFIILSVCVCDVIVGLCALWLTDGGRRTNVLASLPPVHGSQGLDLDHWTSQQTPC